MGLFSGKKHGVSVINVSMSPSKSVKLIRQNGPAVSRETVSSSGGVDLTKKFDKAGISLSKKGLDGVRAQAVLVLDYSGSMSTDYSTGTVQTLVERALGFALQIDADGKIPVIPFASSVLPIVEVTLANYQGVVQREVMKHQMGSTNLTDALQLVKHMSDQSEEPIFCIVVTDGYPDNARSCKQLVIQLAGYPVFIKFLGIREVQFLHELDDLPDTERLLDNVDAQILDNPAGMTDLAFADAMTEEWDSWIQLATRAGVLM